MTRGQVAPAHFRPPVPHIPDEPLSSIAFLRTVRTNALAIWPAAAYERETLVRRLFGRNTVLLNAPDAIHHVLIGSRENFRRSPASLRILRPIFGAGLLLSEGEDWKLQRRTIGPALSAKSDADADTAHRRGDGGVARRSAHRGSDRTDDLHANAVAGYRWTIDIRIGNASIRIRNVQDDDRIW
jgi:Cytochrome P450